MKEAMKYIKFRNITLTDEEKRVLCYSHDGWTLKKEAYTKFSYLLGIESEKYIEDIIDLSWEGGTNDLIGAFKTLLIDEGCIDLYTII